MERVRIVSLKNIRKRQVVMIRAGQREAARVWTLCRDRHLAARQEHGKWPNRDALQKATIRPVCLALPDRANGGARLSGERGYGATATKPRPDGYPLPV